MSFQEILIKNNKFFLTPYGQTIPEDKNKLYLLVPISIANLLNRLNNLPEDIIKYMMLNMDIKDIFSLCSTCKRLNTFCQSIIYEKLSKLTILDISNYTLKQLKILYANKIFGTKRIVSKHDRTLVVKNNGEVYIMGLYDGAVNPPSIIKDLKDVIKVDIANDIVDNFEVYLTKNGEVYVSGGASCIVNTWDKNGNHLISDINNAIDISADEETILILLSDGTVRVLINYDLSDEDDPVKSPEVKNIISVYQNGDISYFLSKSGKIYKKDGDYDIEEISDNVTTFEEINSCLTITQINNGKLHVLYSILDDDRKYNKFNEYGVGNLNIIDTAPMENATLLLDNNGDVYLVGNPSSEQYKLLTGNIKSNSGSVIKINGLKDIIYISCSYSNYYFVDINDNVYVLGFNHNGELGTGDYEEVLKPTLNTKIIL